MVMGIILVSLVLAGCGKSSISPNQVLEKGQSGTTKAECMQWCEMMRKLNEWNKSRTQSEMNVDCNSLCDASQGMENNDVNACEKSEWILKDTCFSEIAQDTNDIAVCKRISDKTFLYGCYTAIAEKQKDTSICENIDDSMRNSICVDGVSAE